MAVVMAGLLVAGCGGGGGTGRAAPAADAGLAEFVQCMRRHGVPLADPVVTGTDEVEIRPAQGAPVVARADFDAATRACEAEGHHPFGGGARQAPDRDREDRAVAFARCARREGIALPDPRFEDGEVTNWDPAALGIDLEAPAVVAVGGRCTRESGFDPWEDL